MINALKEITKTWTGFIHYKRFLLPSGGYLSEKSYLEFLDENLTLRLPFKRVFIEYEIDKSTSNIRIEKANFAIGLKETYISFGKNELLENVIEMTPFMKYKGEIWHIFPKIWLPSKQKIKGKKDNLDGILDYRYSEEWKDKRVVAGHVHTTLGFVNALSNRNISISKEKVISAIAAPDPKPYDSYWILK